MERGQTPPQTEMIDKLGIPCARWHSTRKSKLLRSPLPTRDSTNEPNARRLFQAGRFLVGTLVRVQHVVHPR